MEPVAALEAYVVESPKPGDVFVQTKLDGIGMPKDMRASFVVQPNRTECAGPGRWVCLTHSDLFSSIRTKDFHVQAMGGRHVLAWYCARHGAVEVP